MWVAAGILALASTGCVSEPLPTPVPTPTLAPLASPTTTVLTIDAQAWYAGIVIHASRAVAVTDPGGGSVTIDLVLENPGAEPATLEAPILLAAGGRAIEPVRGTELPDIPAAGTATHTLAFEFEGAFDVGRAALRIGRIEDHQAIVPLVAGAVDLVDLAPRALQLDGQAQAGDLRVTLTGAELRADLPDWGLEEPRELLALSISYAASYRSTFTGGFPFTTDSLALRLPDGTTIAARADGRSAPALVLEPTASHALTSRFDVPEPGTGRYVLLVRDGSKEAQLPFEIPAP